jgi:hypothetical protein
MQMCTNDQKSKQRPGYAKSRRPRPALLKRNQRQGIHQHGQSQYQIQKMLEVVSFFHHGSSFTSESIFLLYEGPLTNMRQVLKNFAAQNCLFKEIDGLLRPGAIRILGKN